MTQQQTQGGLPISNEAVEAAARAWVGSMMDDPAKETARKAVEATARTIIQAFLAAEGFEVERTSDPVDSGIKYAKLARLVSPWRSDA